MKIIVTADLHLPMTSASDIKQMISDIQKESPDIVVLAGDLGETRIRYDLFQECIEFFTQKLNCPVLVIPGNHDLWVDPQSPIDSLEMWQTQLIQQTIAAKACWIEDQNFTHKGVSIVGSMLHYDFSAKDTIGPTAGYTKEYFIQNKKRIINDGIFFRGLPEDIVFAKEIGEAFRKRLIDAQMNPHVHEIIVVTHVPCTEQQITRNPHDVSWSLATPFFGNLSHVDWFVNCSKISHIISGHSHRGNKGKLYPTKTPKFKASLREDLKMAGLRSRFRESEYIKTITLNSDYRAPKYKVIQSHV